MVNTDSINSSNQSAIPDFILLHDIENIIIEKLPLPEFPQEIKKLLEKASQQWLSEHKGAYDGLMFFPLKVNKDVAKKEFTISGHYHEHGYALHSILRDNLEQASEIRGAFRKLGIEYDAGLAVSAMLMSEVGVVLFKSNTTAYAHDKVWQLPGGNIQDKDPLTTAIEEVREEMGLPSTITRNALQPFLYIWGGSNKKETASFKYNPTLVYLMSIGSDIIDKYIEPPDDDSELSLDRATKYGVFSVSDIEKLFEGNGEEFTPGVALVLKTMLNTL